MMRDALSQLKNYLSDVGVEALPPSDVPEERAPDLLIATSSSPALEVARVEIGAFPRVSPLFRFFVDGVQRTVAVAEVRVNNVPVPIHLSHLVVGAMERNGNELQPYVVREALVLLLPYQALSLADQSWSTRTPPGQELNWQGDIYSAVQRDGLFFSDTSIGLRLDRSGRAEVLLQAGDLIRTGEVRQKALYRATELLRIMEVGLLWELRKKHPEDWVLWDGSIEVRLKYGRLAAPELQGLEEIAQPDVAFDFLRRVVGAVKRVQIVPSAGLEVCLRLGGSFLIPVYRFGEVIKEDDAVAKEILSAFLWLRRELAGEIPALWSPVSGIARFDIPIPCLLTDDFRSSWNAINDKDISDLLSQGKSGRQMLELILRSIILERWPVPAADQSRMLTELFPIAETEAWLKAQLMSIYEMRSLV